MTAITLTRSDPVRNVHRYYRLDVQQDLFSAWCLIREWGRIGGGCRLRSIPYSTEPEARVAFDHQLRRRLRRGYLVKVGLIADTN